MIVPIVLAMLSAFVYSGAGALGFVNWDDPADVYENPSNKFVADFIGEANFFDGTVVASDASEVAIALGPLTLYAPLNGEAPQVGAKASFSVRPERLRIHPDGAGREAQRNVYAARVEDHDYLGAVVRYYLRLGDGLMVKADEHNVSGIRYRSGETVSVEIPPDVHRVIQTESK